MKKNNAISVDDAINKFYNRNKLKLDAIFGSERSAKSHLKYDVPDLPAKRFNDKKHATKLFNDYLERLVDPAKFELKIAKQEAIANDPAIFKDYKALNRKIDKYGYIKHSTYLGKKDGYDVSMVGYYDVKNSDYVLAYNRYFNGDTEIFAWEFTDRGLL